MSEEENLDLSNVNGDEDIATPMSHHKKKAPTTKQKGVGFGSSPNKFKNKEFEDAANEFDSRPSRTIATAPIDFSLARSADAINRWVRDTIIGDVIKMVSLTTAS